MLVWALLTIIKGSFSEPANKKTKSKKVSFERRSVRALSTISSTTTLRKRKQSWIVPPYALEAEIFENIMKWCSPGDAAKLLQVCQVWSGPAAEALYQSPPILYADSFPKLAATLLKNDTMHPYPLLIREFIFTGNLFLILGLAADELYMGDLKECLKLCSNLVSFRIEGCSHLSNLLAQFLAEHAPFLSRIELPGCTISDAFLVQLIRGVTSLRHIDVSFSNVTLSALPILVRECRYLETLIMTGCRPSPPEMVIDYEASEYYLVGDTLKQYKNNSLKQVSLSYTELTDAMVGYLCRHCDSLQYLIAEGCNLLTDTAINSIAMHCPAIIELDLSLCVQVTDIGLQALAVHLSVQGEKTNRQRPTSFGYSSFQEYTPPQKKYNTTPLRKINITGCHHITPPAIVLLASKCPNLNTIIIDRCDRLIDWYNHTDSPVSPVPTTAREGFSQDSDSDEESFVSARSRHSFAMDMLQSERKLQLNRDQVMRRKREL
ncbi:hypothetical protein HDV01_004120 [Terramyces sp. JEL0728]|nr:hypothetical protein HDV01_004120 [Terramyces sp. JEL0728]